MNLRKASFTIWSPAIRHKDKQDRSYLDKAVEHGPRSNGSRKASGFLSEELGISLSFMLVNL